MAIPLALTATLNALSAGNFILVSLGIGLNNSDEINLSSGALREKCLRGEKTHLSGSFANGRKNECLYSTHLFR